MDLNSNNKQSNVQQKKSEKKEEKLNVQEIINIVKSNTKSRENIESDSIKYEKEQDIRDNNLFEIESVTDEKLNFVNEDIKSMQEDLRDIQKTISLLAKNFKTFVKTTEIDFIKAKLDSLKFEKLANKQDLEKYK